MTNSPENELPSGAVAEDWMARLRRALLVFALSALAIGIALAVGGHADAAHWLWVLGTVPIAASLFVGMLRELLAGRVGVDAIALVSMVAALALAQPLAGVVVAIMYAGGNVLEDYAVGRAERDLRALIDRSPRIAHRRVDDAIRDVAVDDVEVGDRLVVRGGEVVPVDGAVVGGGAVLDESALTGEAMPVNRQAGEAVRSGTVNAGDTFEMTAMARAGESTFAGIIRLVTAAQTAKAPFSRLADRYALLLLPVTLVLAGASWLLSGDPVRALAVLVAATPCPLILAAPVAFIGGISQAARNGILIKGGAALEALARIKTVMFDKTGTLTVGGARLLGIDMAPGTTPDDVLQLAGSLEQSSQHVVAAAIVAAARARGLTLLPVTEVRETMGSGLQGRVGERLVKAGSLEFVHGRAKPADWASRALRRASWRSALTVFVAVDGEMVGALLLGDQLRRESPRTIEMLRGAGISRIAMVTGDRAETAEMIGAALDLDAVLADRVPEDKVEAVATEQRLHPTLMVGDGINDAPALAAATVGIAMGARGASASSQAADVVIVVDRIDKVAQALVIAKRARNIAVESIVVGMSLSGIAMVMASVGQLTPVAGALVQEAIDVAVILNALRALTPARSWLPRPTMTPAALRKLRGEHEALSLPLARLREIADELDDAEAEPAVALINEANQRVLEIAEHESADERRVYPVLAHILSSRHGLVAMSRAHREIQHLARMLARISVDLEPKSADRYLIRDAQRAIEAIVTLVTLHSAQEDDIYEHSAEAQ